LYWLGTVNKTEVDRDSGDTFFNQAQQPSGALRAPPAGLRVTFVRDEAAAASPRTQSLSRLRTFENQYVLGVGRSEAAAFEQHYISCPKCVEILAGT